MPLSDEYERFVRFGGECVMSGLQARPRIFVKGILIPNPYYGRARRFLGDS